MIQESSLDSSLNFLLSGVLISERAPLQHAQALQFEIWGSPHYLMDCFSATSLTSIFTAYSWCPFSNSHCGALLLLIPNASLLFHLGACMDTSNLLKLGLSCSLCMAQILVHCEYWDFPALALTFITYLAFTSSSPLPGQSIWCTSREMCTYPDRGRLPTWIAMLKSSSQLHALYMACHQIKPGQSS